eukprot:155875_1
MLQIPQMAFTKRKIHHGFHLQMAEGALPLRLNSHDLCIMNSDKSIDCLSVSIPTSSNAHVVPDDELVVRASWQTLGNDSEVSLALCYFVGLLKYFFGDQTHDD